MRYTDFVNIMTASRMNRYLFACSGDTRKAMTLYRRNLQLSQEFFTIISCFEVALRNKIDNHYFHIHGNNWLKNAAGRGGFYDNPQNYNTKVVINTAIAKLNTSYTHNKLVAGLGLVFGGICL